MDWNYKDKHLGGNTQSKRVMIQPQTIVQTYFVQTDVTLIYWLNKNIK